MPEFCNNFIIERVVILLIMNWSCAWIAGVSSCPGFSIIEQVRFSPEALNHLFPLCPRPEVW